MENSGQQQQEQRQSSGLPLHIQGQLEEAAAIQLSQTSPARGRGRGRGSGQGQGYPRRGRGAYQPLPLEQQTANAHSWRGPLMENPTNTNPFPSLGDPHYSVQQQPRFGQNYNQQPFNPRYHPHSMSQMPPQSDYQVQQEPPREFFLRARGNQHRGASQGQHFAHNHQQPASGHVPPQNPNDFIRPLPAQRTLFTAGGQPYFASIEEQRAFHKKIMNQSDFLNHLANQSLKSNQLSTEEQKAKETFRKELEGIAQRVVGEKATNPLNFNPQDIELRLYGSLGSGFGLAGCDMDILLAFPQDRGPLGDIEIESRRMLEKALLDAGIGARLLTNTRVPILRVCQKPSPELLENLREERVKWEQSLEPDTSASADNVDLPLPELTRDQEDAAETALADLVMDARTIPLPKSPPPDHARLEYVGDCGIQCDINFQNHVALHNTRLLKTYGMCDPRVRQVGVFVKSWAKTRKINTPYYGTLSSYGYILMVLHYLMNVVSPPVIPNLQEAAKLRDFNEGKENVHLVEGFDVRFIRDMTQIQQICQGMRKNVETVGSLLRGFFWYYADSRSFNWNQSIISIRTQGGLIPKRAKGWTTAKRAAENQNIRLRYLLAIEDPFELEHNVARTVGHHGIVAIRNEFRSAWEIISNVQHDNETKLWFWLNDQGQRNDAEQMMARVEVRGDLLRKDQEYNKQKTRQMRQELEAKEQALRSTTLENTGDQSKTPIAGRRLDPALIDDGAIQIPKPPTKGSRRKLQIHRWDDDDSEDAGPPPNNIDWTTQAEDQSENNQQIVQPKSINWDVSFTKAELGPEYIPPEDDETMASSNMAVTSSDNTVNHEVEQDLTQDNAKSNQAWTNEAGASEMLFENQNEAWSNGHANDGEWDKEDRSDQHWDNQNQSTEDQNNERYASQKQNSESWDRELMTSGVQYSSNARFRRDKTQLPFIAWDPSTADGRWLLARDGRIRAGWRRVHHYGIFAMLDEFFPYNPNMSVLELAKKNELLRSRRWREVRREMIDEQKKSTTSTDCHAKDTRTENNQWYNQNTLNRNTETNTTDDTASQNPSVAWSDSVAMEDEIHRESTSKDNRHLSLSSEQQSRMDQAKSSNQEQTNSEKEKKTARRKKNSRKAARKKPNPLDGNEFAPKIETDSKPSTMSVNYEHSRKTMTTSTNTNVTDTATTISQQEQPSSFQDQSQPPLKHQTPQPSQLHQAPSISNEKSSDSTHQTSTMPPPPPPPPPPSTISTTISAALDREAEASYPNPKPTRPPTKSAKQYIEIYQTFHLLTAPKDPDSKPISQPPIPTSPPVQPNFQLDPRHLADLETIKRGGNGCVRTEQTQTT